MSLGFIRQHYNVPAKIQGRVRYTGNGKPVEGTITGLRGRRLWIRLDGQPKSKIFHPSRDLEYLEQA